MSRLPRRERSTYLRCISVNNYEVLRLLVLKGSLLLIDKKQRDSVEKTEYKSKPYQMPTILIIGITLDFIGTILIAYTVLRVHNRAREARRTGD